MGHLHNEILFSCKKEENFTLCNSMDGPREHFAKCNNPVRERQIPYDFTHMWNLWTNWTNKKNRDRLIYGEQMIVSGGRGAKGVEESLGGGGIEQKGKNAHEQQCADCWGQGT